MNLTTKQLYTYSTLAFVLFIVIVYVALEKSKREKEKEFLRQQILNGVGMQPNDVTIDLATVKPEYYADVDNDVQRLENAKGFFNDDEQAIYAVLSNKSKSQLLGLSNRLQVRTGFNLNNWLEDVLDGQEIDYAKLIIRNAH